MKRLWMLLLLLAVFAIPARAEMDGDGVYTLYDDQGNELTMRAGRMFVGDEYISGDDRLYRVASVDDAQKTARAEYIGPRRLRRLSGHGLCLADRPRRVGKEDRHVFHPLRRKLVPLGRRILQAGKRRHLRRGRGAGREL